MEDATLRNIFLVIHNFYRKAVSFPLTSGM